jgi:hypothetical protein
MLRIKGCTGLFIDTLLIMTAVITNHIEITPGICGGKPLPAPLPDPPLQGREKEQLL